MKTVIEMAREANALSYVKDADSTPHLWAFSPKELERFAELVRADAIATEREACAKVVNAKIEEVRLYSNELYLLQVAAAIRNRSKT